MCSRGIFQLKFLQIFYCDYGGSSAKIRLFLPTLIEHPLLNQPKINLQIYMKKNTHPYLNGIYVNGYQKQISLKGLEDDQEIIDRIALLRNSFGQQSVRHAGRKVTTLTPSIQGGWNENLFKTNIYPRHQMEISRSYPPVEVPEPRIVPRDKPIDVYEKRVDPYQQIQKPKLGVKKATNI
ncbi:unnamed protein product [Paramecium octaurelia]|uniref:Ribosomal protein/NADH dehydrogenase domain-containing protein n=1 Tax=Paramecium octaurelia TaxID=43137 RepID=A0A8S1SM68_PAROT|nr:unnamed protein product [Paramecium octaurelia]